MLSVDPLFRPFQINNLTLPNRIVMAPMTRWKSPGQRPTAEVAAYYRRRAEGGVGLILTEGTSIDQAAASDHLDIPAFFGEQALAGWAEVVSQVKSAGGRIMPQLWHQGTARAPGSGPYPKARTLGPSGLTLSGDQIVDPMTVAEVEAVIEGFARSAATARELGFDGVELHGAHGYLIDQFFWDRTNRRADAYGSGITERSRFAAEIVRAVRDRVGPDFPIVLRFSQWKMDNYSTRMLATPQDLEAFLAPLVDAGVDMFHCSTRRFWEPEFPDADARLNLAGWTRKIAHRPTITVGSIALQPDDKTSYRSRGATVSAERMDDLIAMLDRDEIDLVAIGRALLANPDLPRKLRDGAFDRLEPFSPEMLERLY